MQKLEEIIAAVDGFVWGIPLIVLILGVGIYLTVRLVFLPVRKLGRAFKYMFEKEEGAGEVSSFGALCTALSATIGTGNIVGVATAICAGGPGALFWMWLAAFFGMATKYAEGLLAVKYRKVYPDGHTLGGPFYYIENGLGKRWKFLAVIFAVLALLSGVVIRETKDYFRRFPKGKDALPSVGEEPATGDASDFGIPPEGEADAAARAGEIADVRAGEIAAVRAGEIAASARAEARAARERGALARAAAILCGQIFPRFGKGS